MRSTLRCAKCQHREILHVTEIGDKDPIEDGAVLAIQSERPMWTPGAFRNFGVIEAYVCAHCGFTELYTRDPGSVHVDGKIVRRLTADDAPPYR